MMTSLLGRTVAHDILSSTGDHLRQGSPSEMLFVAAAVMVVVFVSVVVVVIVVVLF